MRRFPRLILFPVPLVLAPFRVTPYRKSLRISRIPRSLAGEKKPYSPPLTLTTVNTEPRGRTRKTRRAGPGPHGIFARDIFGGTAKDWGGTRSRHMSS